MYTIHTIHAIHIVLPLVHKVSIVLLCPLPLLTSATPRWTAPTAHLSASSSWGSSWSGGWWWNTLDQPLKAQKTIGKIWVWGLGFYDMLRDCLVWYGRSTSAMVLQWKSWLTSSYDRPISQWHYVCHLFSVKRQSIITLVAFARLFSTVYFQMWHWSRWLTSGWKNVTGQ